MRSALLTLIAILAVLPSSVYAQETLLLLPEPPAIEYLRRHTTQTAPAGSALQRLPLSQGDLRAALDSAGVPHADPLRRIVSGETATPALGVLFRASAHGDNTGRRDLLRPIDDGAPPLLPEGRLVGWAAREGFVAAAGLHFAPYIDQDPEGIDAARRLYIRPQPAYLGYRSDWLQIYAGRFAVDLAATDRSLFYQDPLVPSDKILLRLEAGAFHFTSFVAELDKFTERPDSELFQPGGIRRYFAAHRLQWSPSPHIAIGVIETVLYGAENAGLSLAYANPFLPYTFEVANRPRNVDDNGSVGLDVETWFSPIRARIQILLDDFDFVNDREAASIAGRLRLDLAPLSERMDAAFAISGVTARTYSTQQPYLRYEYLERGLGLPFSDFVHAMAELDLYFETGNTRLTPRIDWLAQGSWSIDRPFPDDADASVGVILVDPVAYVTRPSLQLWWQPHPLLWLEADAGWNVLDGDTGNLHVERDGFTGSLRLGLTLSHAWPL